MCALIIYSLKNERTHKLLALGRYLRSVSINCPYPCPDHPDQHVVTPSRIPSRIPWAQGILKSLHAGDLPPVSDVEAAAAKRGVTSVCASSPGNDHPRTTIPLTLDLATHVRGNSLKARIVDGHNAIPIQWHIEWFRRFIEAQRTESVCEQSRCSQTDKQFNPLS